MMRTGNITLTIDSQLDQVFLVGLAVNKICASIPLSEQLAYEAEVSVVEAINNVIKHGYGNRCGHSVEVEMSVEPERVVFKVRDHGIPLERLNVTLPEADRAHYHSLPEGGRGLYIMHMFTDNVSYDRIGDRNVLTLTKLLPARQKC